MVSKEDTAPSERTVLFSLTAHAIIESEEWPRAVLNVFTESERSGLMGSKSISHNAVEST